MFHKKRYLRLTNQELQVILHSLVELRNSLIQQGLYADCVDELILKFSE